MSEVTIDAEVVFCGQILDAAWRSGNTELKRVAFDRWHRAVLGWPCLTWRERTNLISGVRSLLWS